MDNKLKEAIESLREICASKNFIVHTYPVHYDKHVLVFWSLGIVMVSSSATVKDIQLITKLFSDSSNKEMGCVPC